MEKEVARTDKNGEEIYLKYQKIYHKHHNLLIAQDLF